MACICGRCFTTLLKTSLSQRRGVWSTLQGLTRNESEHVFVHSGPGAYLQTDILPVRRRRKRRPSKRELRASRLGWPGALQLALTALGCLPSGRVQSAGRRIRRRQLAAVLSGESWTGFTANMRYLPRQPGRCCKALPPALV